MDHSLLYLSSYNELKDSGVGRKIAGFCLTANQEGFNAVAYNYYCRRKSEWKELVSKIEEFEGKYIVIRSMGALNLHFIHAFLKARRRGKVLILDQPTPMKSQIREILESETSFFKKLYRIIRLYINGPWGQLPFNRIIQYGNESAYFLFLNRKRTILLGNGIEENRVPLRQNKYGTIKDHINLIAVASSIVSWHGFDRIVRAMNVWNSNNKNLPIRFEIIGNDNTEEADRIKTYAKECGLEHDVVFSGYKDTKYIHERFAQSHLAVGSLGLFRKKLSISSILKIREYCLAGIPFIASGSDPDFPESVPFRFEVSNDDNIADILNVFRNYPEIRENYSDEEIRNYAIQHLSLKSKFHTIIGGL